MRSARARTATAEIVQGARFAFGENWSRFAQSVDDQRIARADESLQDMLESERLEGLSFLDAGSGSGLFSLAARRLGAQVTSFDYDPRSVACTEELKRRFFPGDSSWHIEQGSVLDKEYLANVGQFDIVYSWGVLHHTGQMWQAMENVAPLVRPGGKLFIAIYNTQVPWTPVWRLIKKIYNRLPTFLKMPYVLLLSAGIELRSLVFNTVTGNPRRYFHTRKNYRSNRGMSHWHDTVDWIGGYPFETAKPEEVFDFYRGKGFSLQRITTCGGSLGCNQYVFQRNAGP